MELTAKIVHAVIAAGLENPDLLQRWMNDPEQVRQFGIDPAEFDWQGLWYFIGLGNKVRYNPLRAVLPLTFRVLKATGIDIELFSHYALQADALRREGKNDVEDKMRALYAFFIDWMDGSNPHHVLIRDMMHHEMLLTTLRKPSYDVNSQSEVLPLTLVKTSAMPEGEAIPVVNGLLELHEMCDDPDRVQNVLIADESALETCDLEPCCLGYWQPLGTVDVHLLRLDYLGFYLLHLVDNNRSIEAISRILQEQGAHLSTEDVIQGLMAFADQHVITLGAKQAGDEATTR